MHTELDSAVFRRSSLPNSVHRKLKLKIKSELITSRFPVEKKQNDGTYLSPQEFQKQLQKGDICLVDMRNHYETAIGTFKKALRFPLREFSELPKAYTHIESHIKKFHGKNGKNGKKKNVLTFCTGGVRCEKAVPFFRSKGIEAFQLHGGILHYLEKYGGKSSSYWEGECFVFDDRVSVTPQFEAGSYSWCSRCGQPSRSGVCVVCG